MDGVISLEEADPWRADGCRWRRCPESTTKKDGSFDFTISPLISDITSHVETDVPISSTLLYPLNNLHDFQGNITMRPRSLTARSAETFTWRTPSSVAIVVDVETETWLDVWSLSGAPVKPASLLSLHP